VVEDQRLVELPGARDLPRARPRVALLLQRLERSLCDRELGAAQRLVCWRMRGHSCTLAVAQSDRSNSCAAQCGGRARESWARVPRVIDYVAVPHPLSKQPPSAAERSIDPSRTLRAPFHTNAKLF
jgi:hypothetical protein